LRVEDSGKGGPPTVDAGAIGPDGKQPIVQIQLGGTPVLPGPGLSVQDILGAKGVTLPDNPILSGTIGAPPKAIPGRTNAFRWDDISKELACDLTNVKVTDTATAPQDKGPNLASASITSASNGGQIASGTVKKGTNAVVTWSLPDYHPGDPPVNLTIGGTL